ncbi:MAG: pentapeptide repeat-containing protein [Acidobacteriia bacterium]|nr:pentapeptide repeat-containing protein [Terriglobia bacterium]
MLLLQSCRGNMASFERASLFATQWQDTVVEDGNFEFADLRNAVFTRCWFGRSCFVGAALEGAQFIECDLTGADFYWSDFDDSKCFSCELKDIRRPEEQKIVYGPKGVKPPVVIPKPLYRQATSEEERQKLLASCLEPLSENAESGPKK